MLVHVVASIKLATQASLACDISSFSWALYRIMRYCRVIVYIVYGGVKLG